MKKMMDSVKDSVLFLSFRSHSCYLDLYLYYSLFEQPSAVSASLFLHRTHSFIHCNSVLIDAVFFPAEVESALRSSSHEGAFVRRCCLVFECPICLPCLNLLCILCCNCRYVSFRIHSFLFLRLILRFLLRHMCQCECQEEVVCCLCLPFISHWQ